MEKVKKDSAGRHEYHATVRTLAGMSVIVEPLSSSASTSSIFIAHETSKLVAFAIAVCCNLYGDLSLARVKERLGDDQLAQLSRSGKHQTSIGRAIASSAIDMLLHGFEK